MANLGVGGKGFQPDPDEAARVAATARQRAAASLAEEESGDAAITGAASIGGGILGAIIGALATVPTGGIVNPASGAAAGSALGGGIADIATSDNTDEEDELAAASTAVNTAVPFTSGLGKALASSFQSKG